MRRQVSKGVQVNYKEAFVKQDDIEYLANDGVWYKLTSLYPLWIACAEHPERIFLDNGQPGPRAHFMIVELRDDHQIWILKPGTENDMVKGTSQWRLAE